MKKLSVIIFVVFLGYSRGSVHKHIKHGIAFIGLTIVFLLGAWMFSGKSSKASSTSVKPEAKSV